jgi:hypothetical protein
MNALSGSLRAVDRLDTGPRFTAHDAVRLNNLFRGSDTLTMLEAVLTDGLAGDVAVVSSFGAESAVLLHLIGTIDASVPVLFLDTGKHFPATLAYRDALSQRLRLTDLRILAPDPEDLAARDENGRVGPSTPMAAATSARFGRWPRRLEGSTPASPAASPSRPPPAPICHDSSSIARTRRAGSRSIH